MKPNRIDFDEIFKKFPGIPETGSVAFIATVVVALMTYVVVLIFARRADKKDASSRVSLKGYHLISVTLFSLPF